MIILYIFIAILLIRTKYLFNSSVWLTEQSVTLRFYCNYIMFTIAAIINVFRHIRLCLYCNGWVSEFREIPSCWGLVWRSLTLYQTATMGKGLGTWLYHSYSAASYEVNYVQQLPTNSHHRLVKRSHTHNLQPWKYATTVSLRKIFWLQLCCS